MGAWKTSIMAALAVLALLAGPQAAAQVPDPYARDLAQKLTRAELSLSGDGYMHAAGPFAGGLPPRENRRITLTLRAGREYAIVGVCDERCGLDLRLRGPNDAPIARGLEEGGASFMLVRPALTGPHVVDVDLARCAAPECWYAVNVYIR